MARAFSLKTEEREDAKEFGIAGYLRSNDWKAVKERIYETLDKFRETMASGDLPDANDPDILIQLTTVIVRTDRTVAGYFFKRRPQVLEKEPGRTEFFELLAKVIVQRYVTDRELEAEPARLVITEHFYEQLDDLLQLAVEAGQLAEKEGREAKEAVWGLPNNVVDPVEAAKEKLVALLKGYEDLAPPADEQDVPTEVQRREIGEAALLRLRASDLENLAAQNGIVEKLGREGLAAALVKKLDSDHEKIAKLVLDAEKDDPERGLVTRLVPLAETPSLPAAGDAIKSLKGRYYGTRVAQWFVFHDVLVQPNRVVITGLVRSFTVRPAEVGDTPQLNPNPHKDAITITLRRNVRWAEVTARRLGDLRAAQIVLKRAARLKLLDTLPLPDAPDEDAYRDWDKATLALLDFLQRELSGPTLEINNFRMARFETPTKSARDDDPSVPRIRSVRLTGQHLASHREACQLIVDGRAMLDVEVRLRQDRGGGNSRYASVRFEVGTDYLAVMTGFDDSGNIPDDLHRMLTQLARDAAGRPLTMNSLRPLLAQIAARAAQQGPALAADILAPVVQAQAGDGAGDGDPTAGTGNGTTTAPASGPGSDK